MKTRSLASIVLGLTCVAVLLSASAQASNKVCFGSTRDDETKGLVMTAQIDRNKVTLRTIKGEYGDYQDHILIDQVLLRDRTSGLLQIRARGEGFFNAVFVCKDDRN